MALSQKHRDIIYLRLAPILGVEAAEAFMAELPTTKTTTLGSTDVLRAELAGLRTEMAELRGEMRTEMAQLRGDLRIEMAVLRSEMRIEMASHRARTPVTQRRSRTAPR